MASAGSWNQIGSWLNDWTRCDEARKGRFGILGDINFIRVSTDVSYTTPIISAPIAGTLELEQIIFNGKVIFEPKPGRKFHLVGGIRTLTMSPTAHFTGPVGGQLADIDVSKTGVAGVGGFIYRPRLGQKVVLLMQADIGDVPKNGSGPVNEVQYAVTQYGPAFSLTFHWTGK